MRLFDSILLHFGPRILRVLVLVHESLVPPDELEGRSDDNEHAIRERMRVYEEKTKPLIAYYRERGVLREVDGMGSVDEVARRVAHARNGVEKR